MRDDELLQRLGRRAREDATREDGALDERWDALARGELTRAEEDELRRTNPEAYEMFRPLDGAFRDEIAHRVCKPPISRGKTAWSWLAAASGLAAVLVFLVLLPADPGDLPRYALHVDGGSRTVRSEAPDSVSDVEVRRVLHPGDRLEVVLRPETAVEVGGVEAKVFVVPDGVGEPRELSGLLEVADSGAVRLVGTVGEELAWPAGRLDLWIAVGRPGRVPRPDGQTTDGLGNRWRIPLRIEP